MAVSGCLRRTLLSLCVCQALRMLCFLSTRLPGPGRHCRLGPDSTVVDAPTRLIDWLIVDVARQATKGCGDLVFSSHVIFGATFVLAWRRYTAGTASFCIALLLLQAYAIIAARKHYSLDVLAALFVAPLVWDAIDRRLVDPIPKQAPKLPL